MLDYKALQLKLKALTPRKRLYKLLKTELTKLGYWRNRPRGNPKKAFKAMKARLKARQV